MIDKQSAAIIQKLEEIGLSTKEARVYIDLLSRDSVIGTSKIVRSTGLHGQFIYDALASLEEMGLVSHVTVGKRKKFAAVDPSRLMYLVEQRKRVVTEVVRDLAVTQKNRFQDFDFFLGEEAFVAHEFDELGSAEEAETWCIIAGSGDRFYDYFSPEQLTAFDRERIAKRILIKYIGSDTQRADLKKISLSRPLFEFKVLKNFGHSIVNTVIRPKSFSLSTYGDKLLTYTVTNPEVAESYKNFFTSLWGLAE